MQDDIAIEADHLVKRFTDTLAVDDVSFAVPRGTEKLTSSTASVSVKRLTKWSASIAMSSCTTCYPRHRDYSD